jgi:hypothetical protein
MNGHVTESRLNTVINIPLALAQTDFRRDTSILLGSVKLSLGQTLQMGWLSLQLIKINLTSAAPVRINMMMGLVYMGIFAGSYNPLRRPSGIPLSFVSLSGPNTKIINPYVPRIFSGPDTVDVIIVNNTTDTDVELMAAGSLKLYTHG